MINIDTDIKKKLKPTVKSIIVLTATLVVILLFGFVSFFFSRNAYHHEIFVDYDNTTSLYPYNVIEMIGYEEVPGGMIAVEEDPQIIITPPDHAVEAIRVVFKNPLYGRRVQVYFAENHEPLSEENSVSAYFRDGDTEILIHIPEGTGAVLTSLRVDIDIFDQTFELYGIYAVSFYTITTWVGNNEWWPLTIALIVFTIGLWFVYVLRRSPEGMFEKFKKIPAAFWVFIVVIAILFVYYHHRDVLPRAEQPFIIETIITGNIEYEDHLYSETVSESVDTGFIIGAYWVFAILLLVGLLLTVYLLYIKNLNVEKAFLVVASIIGFTYLFLTFSSTHDARPHFHTAYSYTNIILGYPQHSMRSADNELIDTGWVNYDSEHDWHVTIEHYAQLHNSLFDGAGDYEILETRLNIAVIPPWLYTPAVLGIMVARLFNANTVMLHFAAGLFGMIFFIAGTFLAIKIIPLGKVLLFCIALFPTTMNQAASSSADNMMNILGFLIIALVIYISEKLANDRQIRIWDIVSLAVLYALIIPARGGVYVPLLGLLILILIARKKRVTLTKTQWIVLVGSLSVMLAIIVRNVPWYAIIFTISGGGYGWDLALVLQNPMDVLYIFLNTFVRRGEDLLLFAVGLGVGWWFPALPYISIIIAFIVVTLLSVQQDTKLSRKQRTVIGVVAILSVLATFTSMFFVAPTSLDAYIIGLQGRYFTPMLPLVFLLFAGIPWLQLKHDISKGIITTLFSLQILVIVNYFVIAIWR